MATISYGLTNDTTKAQTVIDCIEDAMTRQGAWTKIATVMSDTSQPCSIWRNTGTRNALGRDFYIAIGRELGTAPTSFSLAVAEGFDQSKGHLIRPAPGSGAGSAMPAEDFSYGGGISYPVWNGTSLNTTDIAWNMTSVGSTVRQVWAIASNDVIMVSHSSQGYASGYVEYAGLAEPFRNDDPGIICVASTSRVGAVTRHPTITTVNTANWKIGALSSTNCIWTQRSGQLGASGDRLHNSRPVGSRVLVRHTGTAADTGTLRGLLLSVLSVDTASDVYSPGERLFVNDDVFMFPGATSIDLWANTTPT